MLSPLLRRRTIGRLISAMKTSPASAMPTPAPMIGWPTTVAAATATTMATLRSARPRPLPARGEKASRAIFRVIWSKERIDTRIRIAESTIIGTPNRIDGMNSSAIIKMSAAAMVEMRVRPPAR